MVWSLSTHNYTSFTFTDLHSHIHSFNHNTIKFTNTLGHFTSSLSYWSRIHSISPCISVNLSVNWYVYSRSLQHMFTAVTYTTSLHFQLVLVLFCLTLATQLCSSHIYSLAPYLYLSYDYVSSAALVTHHTFIASIIGLGSAAHYSIFLVRDYTTTAYSVHNLLLAHKAHIHISLLIQQSLAWFPHSWFVHS